ncbi:inositol monophosphatase family protein [Virgibacillus soli]|uniref:inositol-phosphate phosphatase n=1 Tax=Paracerasibacillus soli TaxID=480284 RepID=A0ABU5CNX7_9BACI|nr:inositol monophosphatase family protein [Virgibacillus soli]MDY0408063.1 inositol monophosphatase family protein [Virgibacillus soli]
MDKTLRDELFQKAKQWVYEAGELIKERMNEPLSIDTKSNANDLVTILDKETEKFFIKKIKANYPEHLVLSEEGFGDKLKSLDGIIWIIDPIDGTMNFVHQKRNFAISLGIYCEGIGEIGIIYDVMGNCLYHAKKGEGAYKNEKQLAPLKEKLVLKESIIGMNHYWLCENRLIDHQDMQQFIRTIRGVRTYGSAALEFAYVAEGILDAYLTMKLSPWDIAAGIVIVQEVGGVTTDIFGQPVNMLTDNPVMVANSVISEQIATVMRKGKK